MSESNHSNAASIDTRIVEGGKWQKRQKTLSKSKLSTVLSICQESEDHGMLVRDRDIALFLAMDASSSLLRSVESQHHFSAAPVDAYTARAEQTQGQELTEFPLDYSLKTSVKFISPQTFEWCSIPLSPEGCSGLQYFTNGLLDQFTTYSTSRGLPTERAGQGLRNGTQFQQCLHSWTHPQVFIPSVVSKLVSGTGRESRVGAAEMQEFLENQAKSWRESLQSLFSLYLRCECPTFYIHGPRFTALFLSLKDKTGSSDYRFKAFLTKTSRGMRSSLSSLGIKFSMPLSRGEEDLIEFFNHSDDAELKEFQDMYPEQVYQSKSKSSKDYTSESLLMFEGVESVSGLVKYLQDFKESLGFMDRSALYSPMPFVGSSILTPQVIARRIQTASNVSKDNSSLGMLPVTLMYSLELQRATIFPPWVVQRVTAVLQQYHTSSFEGSFSTESSTEAINHGLNYKISQEKVNLQTREMDYSESNRTDCASCCRSVKSIICKNRKFRFC